MRSPWGAAQGPAPSAGNSACLCMACAVALGEGRPRRRVPHFWGGGIGAGTRERTLDIAKDPRAFWRPGRGHGSTAGRPIRRGGPPRGPHDARDVRPRSPWIGRGFASRFLGAPQRSAVRGANRGRIRPSRIDCRWEAPGVAAPGGSVGGRLGFAWERREVGSSGARGGGRPQLRPEVGARACGLR